jgi:hypothetical protein
VDGSSTEADLILLGFSAKPLICPPNNSSGYLLITRDTFLDVEKNVERYPVKRSLIVAAALALMTGAAMADVPAGFGKYMGWWKSTEGAYLFVDAKHSFGTGGPDCKFTRFAVHADPHENYSGFEIDMMCVDEPQGAGNGLPARSFKPVRVHQLWT